MVPVKLHAKIPLCIYKKIYLKFLRESSLKKLFNFVIKAEIEKVINIDSKVQWRLSRNYSSMKNARVILGGL